MEIFELHLVLWLWLPTVVFSYTYDDVINLKKELIKEDRYDASTRPVYNQSDVVYLNITLVVQAIHGLDEVAESLTTTAWLYTAWRDEYLAWLPEEYGGVNMVEMPQNSVWKPDLVLLNSLQPYKPLGDKSLLLRVNNYGDMKWEPREVFLSTCSIDIARFPLDEHTCSLRFSAWSYFNGIVVWSGGVNIDKLQTNHAWEVIATDWYVDIQPIVTFQITLRRKPEYSMLTLVLPIISLYVLNLFVFVLPSDSGEKSGYAVTVFLAFTVFLTVIDSSFPHNSDAVSYFAIFVIGGTIQSVVITLIVLTMVRCSSYDNDPHMMVPSWFVDFVRIRKCYRCRTKTRNAKDGIAPKTSSSVDMNSAANESDNYDKNNQGMDVKYTWKYCIDSLDAVFLYLFTLSFLVFTIIYFIKIYE